MIPRFAGQRPTFEGVAKMRNRWLHTLLLFIVASSIHAGEEDFDGYEPIVVDPEPNWETAAYTCPLSIKTEKGEFKLLQYSIYDARNYAPRESWALQKPAPRKYLRYRSYDSRDHIHMVCEYEGIKAEFIIYAKDATACGGGGKPPRIACWTTDPYAQ